MSVARLHRWHRAVGLTVAIFVAVLAVTGLALTFTDGLRLDKRYVTDESLLDWYSVKPPPLPLSFRAGAHWVSQAGPRLYFDGNTVGSRVNALRGAILADETVLVGLEHELWLFTLKGEVIERLGSADGVPQSIDAIGLANDGTPVVRANEINYAIALDDGRIEPTAIAPINWVVPARLPKALASELARHYRGHELTLERIVLDLHTGQIFGQIGVTIVTISTLGLVLLALSGVVTWWRRWRRLHRHPHH